MADLDDLKTLHTMLIDSQAGYREAQDKADDAVLSAMARKMLALRARHHAEIDRLLHASGEKPDESGSFMGTVHKTIIKARSAVTGLDQSSLPGFIDGEERISAQYDDVLNTAPSAEIVSALTQQKAELAQMISEMRASSPK